MMLKRKAEWEFALAMELQEASRRVHEWGKHDCAAFGIRCVVAQSGENPWEGKFRDYSDETGAKRAIEDVGGFVAALDRHLRRVRPEFVNRGDVALVNVEGSIAIGIFHGNAIAIAATPLGLGHLPVSAAIKGWGFEEWR